MTLVAAGVGAALVVAFLVPYRRPAAPAAVEVVSGYPVPPLDLRVPSGSREPRP